MRISSVVSLLIIGALAIIIVAVAAQAQTGRGVTGPVAPVTTTSGTPFITGAGTSSMLPVMPSSGFPNTGTTPVLPVSGGFGWNKGWALPGTSGGGACQSCANALYDCNKEINPKDCIRSVGLSGFCTQCSSGSGGPSGDSTGPNNGGARGACQSCANALYDCNKEINPKDCIRSVGLSGLCTQCSTG
jgi:hypothetical protein